MHATVLQVMVAFIAFNDICSIHKTHNYGWSEGRNIYQSQSCDALEYLELATHQQACSKLATVRMLWTNKRLGPSTRPSLFHIFHKIRLLSVCCCAMCSLFKVFFVFWFFVLMAWALPPLCFVLSFPSSFLRNGFWLLRIPSVFILLFF